MKLRDFHQAPAFLVEIRLFRPGRKKHQLNLCNSIGFLGARLGGNSYNPLKSRILWESAHFYENGRQSPEKRDSSGFLPFPAKAGLRNPLNSFGFIAVPAPGPEKAALHQESTGFCDSIAFSAELHYFHTFPAFFVKIHLPRPPA